MVSCNKGILSIPQLPPPEEVLEMAFRGGGFGTSSGGVWMPRDQKCDKVGLCVPF